MCNRAALLMLALASLVATRAAHAQTFNPILPPICGAWQEIDFSYAIADPEWEIAFDGTTGNTTKHSLRHRRHLWANFYVDWMGFRLDFLNLDSGWDWLNYGSENVWISRTDVGPLGWMDLPNNQSFGGHDRPSLEFYTDEIVGSAGFRIGKARVCGNDSTGINRSPTVPTGDRNMGVLLGTGDVVFMSTPVGSARAGEACTAAHDTFALWPMDGADNDFDLYVRCNAYPTIPNWTYRAYTADSKEFIHATAGDCPCGSTWFIAIHSYRGSGQFNFVASKHKKHIPKHYVAVMCNADGTTMTARASTAEAGFRRYFGASEGAFYIDQIEVYDNPQIYPLHHTRFYCNPGNANVPGAWLVENLCNSANHINMYTSSDAPTYSHEIGHYYGCLIDEYYEGSKFSCGHSLMANHWDNNSMCYCHGGNDGAGRCGLGGGTHNRDPTPANASLTGQPPVWTKWWNEGHVSFDMTTHPDEYDYMDFDFNGLFGVTSIYDSP